MNDPEFRNSLTTYGFRLHLAYKFLQTRIRWLHIFPQIQKSIREAR
jgi:hypothetical protein